MARKRLLEQAGHQATVQGIIQDIPLNGGPAVAQQDHPVNQRLQHQREHEEGGRADKDRGQLGVVFLYRPPGEENGDGEA